jgi:alkylation response protein AidB-like acyl-CoA dehydrogenase
MIAARMYSPAASDQELRRQVRDFIQQNRDGAAEPDLGIGGAHDPGFSAALAERGWVGMALPRDYGGSDRGAVERWIVVEELLAAGAPVGAHWLADRQTGPLIARFGPEELRKRFLPEIAAGRCWFAAGMSEPDVGSDLASVRTSARRVDGGWLVTGTKVWTSGAHRSHYMVTLCRTDPAVNDRHAGLSQLIVDLSSSGVTVRPIPFMDGSHHFNEVTLIDVFVPGDLLIGEEGQGWAQVTSELVSERGGPDRYMSVFQLLMLAVRHAPDALSSRAPEFGAIMSRFTTLRRMSYSIAAMIDAGENPAPFVPMVKDLGTVFEQEAVSFLRDVSGEPQRMDHFTDDFQRLLTKATLNSPAFTVRGGTTQILRGMIARGLR